MVFLTSSSKGEGAVTVCFLGGEPRRLHVGAPTPVIQQVLQAVVEGDLWLPPGRLDERIHARDLERDVGGS